jgi:hypothetical protein
MIKTRWGLGLTGAVVLGVIGIFGLSPSGSAPLGLDRLVFVQPDPVPAWSKRIARVDEALGRSELSYAIYEWREAYGAAIRNKGSEGLIAVGDRAIRIAELAGGSSYFLREARYVYAHAALRARAERSREAILGIAEAFEKLGDPERAGQVRRIAESLS